jgi:hypothetical protein
MYHLSKFFFERLRLVIISLLLFQGIYAQDKTQYLLFEIPQSVSLNPAITYKCGNYIELPVLSQSQFYYRNSGFSHRQIFDGGQGVSGDTTRLDLDGLAKSLGNRNHIRLGAKMNLLGMGFEYEDWFFSFNVNNRSNLRFSFNRDIIDIRDGNWDFTNDLPREININGTGLHILNFTEFAIGAGYMIYPGLSAGVRIKYLLGSAHLQTRHSDIRILTSESPIRITGISDLLVRGSLPVSLIEGNDGYVTGVDNQLNSFADLMAFVFNWNHGMGLDAGVIYEYSSDLTLSASILDLGFIHWRKNISVVSQEEEFVFEGIDFNTYLQTSTDTDFFQALEDSVYSSFQLSGSNDPYVAMTPFRLMAAADYQWKEKIRLGAVLEGEILSSRIYPSLTLTAIARPYDNLTASLSYSLMDRGFNSFGFGLVLGNRPLQLYVVTDNIPLRYVSETDFGLLWPYSARTMNLRVGLNIIFGCKDNEAHRKGIKWRKSCPAYD